MREAVAGVVPAAGAGHRFGRPKALVDHGGTLFVERAAGVLAAAGCDPVLVVLGAAAEEVTRRAHLPQATLLVNPDWASGLASSLHTAFDALTDEDRADEVVSMLVLPVDMPGVTAEAARRIADHASPSALAAATYAGVRGHPVLLGREHWAGIRASATGDSGAREYLRHHEVTLVPCDDIAEGFDIDHPADLRRQNP
ncbi:nicotine blue oxidoreductase [Halopolyspora algeriensis]|uniref:Nicotine blue oxidoreductase n=1 Tax=Halopolyspora algeriensis TaxID=1500506 RepID=A0A368VPZ3_9ACTN|nr:nucleotidyltransferase family protein [Halopolyspora algeriensis]RCW42922.1 nicotine blue oxidoreductase [Halopolyspora algeriensis]TQM56609.1 nicotine blue oxidoreductase [Halopolyspora algeriensis]